MDKRLSIALLLTALVVAVTPILFPTPKKTTPGPLVTQTDSSAVSSSSPSQAASKPTTVPSQTGSAPTPAPAGTVMPSSAVDSSATPSTPPVQAQTTSIATPKAVY